MIISDYLLISILLLQYQNKDEQIQLDKTILELTKE